MGFRSADGQASKTAEVLQLINRVTNATGSHFEVVLVDFFWIPFCGSTHDHRLGMWGKTMQIRLRMLTYRSRSRRSRNDRSRGRSCKGRIRNIREDRKMILAAPFPGTALGELHDGVLYYVTLLEDPFKKQAYNKLHVEICLGETCVIGMELIVGLDVHLENRGRVDSV